jgi:hypothetical protein
MERFLPMSIIFNSYLLSVLFAGVKEHNLLACTANVTDVFKNILCLMSDSDDYPLISTKLPILMDACYYYNFSGTIQRNDSKKTKTEQMEEKRKRRGSLNGNRVRENLLRR